MACCISLILGSAVEEAEEMDSFDLKNLVVMGSKVALRGIGQKHR